MASKLNVRKRVCMYAQRETSKRDVPPGRAQDACECVCARACVRVCACLHHNGLYYNYPIQHPRLTL